MSDYIVSIASVGYLSNFGNNFMRAGFVGWPVVGVTFTCMELVMWDCRSEVMKINIDTHVSACSDMLVICQTLHSSAVGFIHYNELY